MEYLDIKSMHIKLVKTFFLLYFPFLLTAQEIDETLLQNLTSNEIELITNSLSGEIKNRDTENELDIIQLDETLQEEADLMDGNIVNGKKFGYDFFSTSPSSTVAVGDLPLPNDYKISLRDKFTVILSGSKEDIFDLSVKLDGTILFPEIGSISVAGETFGEVKEKISNLVDQVYIGVRVDLSIKNLSSKKISIVGAVKTPGTYLVSPFSTITSALSYSGGISEIGSLRKIILIRSSGEKFTFDLYDLLIDGNRSNDITIESGDTILINSASQFVEIVGEINRPAIYEILEDESIEDIVRFALGFTQTANKSNISVSFLNLKETKIEQKTTSDLGYTLNNALEVEVFGLLSEENFSIKVLGSVEKPGFYSIDEYEYLHELIKDLTFVDVYPWLGVLEQFDKKNVVKTTKLFSLKDPSTYQNIKLLPNSKLYFADLNLRTYEAELLSQNLINDYSLNIFFKDRVYKLPVFGNFSPIDLIKLLGLDLSDVESNVTYILPSQDKVIYDDYRNLRVLASKFHTLILRSPINDLITVNISGALNFPGDYTLTSGSTLEDLYRATGEFKEQAYLKGIILHKEAIREKQLESLEIAKNKLNEAMLFSSKANPDGSINDLEFYSKLTETIEPANLGRVAGDYSPGSKGSMNTILSNGDKIIVPNKPFGINVLGEVLNPISFQFKENLKVNDAILLAGGFQKLADKSSVYVIKSDGTIENLKRNIFIRDLRLEPGDTVVVPRMITTDSAVLNALAPITQILSNLAFSAAAIDNLSD